MKITEVRVLQMGAESVQHWNWTFVKIATDAGIHGVGEASLQYKDRALKAEIEDFARFLIGRSPLDIEHIWNSLHRRVTWTGGAVTMSAISAIDLALWDIKGKALGAPVYDLLGGKVRDRLTTYANGWTYGARTPDELAQRAQAVVDSGYHALKLYPFRGPQLVTKEQSDRTVGLVEAVRKQVGEGFIICLDSRTALNPWGAITMAKRVEPYDITWFEEPILFDNVDALADVARSIQIPVATGEQLYTRWEFRAVLEKQAAKIIQPDICHAGGMSELRKIATMAETYYIPISPHNSNGPISTIASGHLDAITPNFFMQEVFINFLPLYNEVLTEPIAIEGGQMQLPEGPGWGTDIKEDVIEAHPPMEHSPVPADLKYF
jgi:galactonate dehydratase